MMWINVSRLFLLLATCIVLPAACICTAAEQLVYTFANQVGAGNFSYFKLHREGVVRLELKTTSGDADLYVSSATLSPDYRNYELSSATCGDDEVLIPADMQRPVGVGVFGHPSHDVSQFVLSVYFSYDEADLESVTLNLDSSQRSTSSAQTQLDADQPESLLWSIFVGLLKIILDILV
jgi:Putative cytokine, C6ORF120